MKFTAVIVFASVEWAEAADGKHPRIKRIAHWPKVGLLHKFPIIQESDGFRGTENTASVSFFLLVEGFS